MTRAYEAEGYRQHVMDWYHPHLRVEPLEVEIGTVGDALDLLVEAGVLPHSRYDAARMLAHREGVRELFEIPWTAITHRMQRLLYAISAIAQPQVMVSVGIFCGNTFISSAGAAIGPGACYGAQRVVGIEIDPGKADLARRNVATIDVDGRAEIIAADGIPWLRDFDGTVNLLYLDADGRGGLGKSIYLDLLEAGLHALRPGSLVLAHNSVNSARQMVDYLDYVRDPANFRESVNMKIDDQGLEVSIL